MIGSTYKPFFFEGDEAVPLPTTDSSVDDQPREVTLFAVPLYTYIHTYIHTYILLTYIVEEG